jgi:hypothetical protein
VPRQRIEAALGCTDECRCDACRKRKTCCVRDPGLKNCSLCRMHSRECEFQSSPRARPARRNPNTSHPAVGNGSSGNRTKEPPAPSQQELTDSSNGESNAVQEVRAEWRMQYVGLSSDQDPFLFQHCSFNDLNYFERPDWVCLRVKQGGTIPQQFTVWLCPSCRLSHRANHGIDRDRQRYGCKATVLPTSQI